MSPVKWRANWFFYNSIKFQIIYCVCKASQVSFLGTYFYQSWNIKLFLKYCRGRSLSKGSRRYLNGSIVFNILKYPLPYPSGRSWGTWHYQVSFNKNYRRKDYTTSQKVYIAMILPVLFSKVPRIIYLVTHQGKK